MPPSDIDIEEESRHFAEVVMTFRSYAQYTLSANNRRRKDLFRLPRDDLELIRGLGFKEKLGFVDQAILENAHFLLQVVESPEIFGHNIDEYEASSGKDDNEDENMANNSMRSNHSHSHLHAEGSRSHTHVHASPLDHNGPMSTNFRPTEGHMDKLRSTLKQLVRDWSVEGKAERDACYEPIKQALLEHFKDVQLEDRSNIRVLVPGAGLARLPFDVAQLGFACQGNEFSHYMLLSSYFILNQTQKINEHRIYPYVHSFSNATNRGDILRPTLIPDVLPSTIPAGSPFSLVAGDFEEVYGGENDPDEPQHGKWDAILTCFFIDTAKNIVNYLRIIHKILNEGGVWINLGPLLWHWENNSTNDVSIELDLEEVKQLAREIGFEISNERMIETTYTNNAKGMLKYTYEAAFWTATKKSSVSGLNMK